MAELVYAFDLKSNGAIRTGSSPVPATIFASQKTWEAGLWCFAGKSRSGYHFYPRYCIALVATIAPSEAAVTS